MTELQKEKEAKIELEKQLRAEKKKI